MILWPAFHSAMQVISMYAEAPFEEITLDEFELMALDRLQVLRKIEDLRVSSQKTPVLGVVGVARSRMHFRGFCIICAFPGYSSRRFILIFKPRRPFSTVIPGPSIWLQLEFFYYGTMLSLRSCLRLSLWVSIP